MTRRAHGLFLVAVTGAVLSSGSAGAQEFRGSVASDDTGEPIRGALVMLLDSSGAVTKATLADAQGLFRIDVPYVGEYYLQAERLGFGVATAGPLTVSTNETISISFRLPLQPVQIEGVGVISERRCVVRPEAGVLAHDLWRQAATALRGAAVAQDQQLIEYTITTYERDVSLIAGTLRTRREGPQRVTGRPFETLSPQQLADGGYIRIRGDSIDYYGPNAHALLADHFLDNHCLRLETDGAEREGLVGIGFEPVREHENPDIRGVIWLEASSGELRHVDYQYTGLPQEWMSHAGGRIEFTRHVAGAWYVSRWWIRMPRIEAIVDWERSGARRDVPVSFLEAGGEVTQVSVHDERG